MDNNEVDKEDRSSRSKGDKYLERKDSEKTQSNKDSKYSPMKTLNRKCTLSQNAILKEDEKKKEVELEEDPPYEPEERDRDMIDVRNAYDEMGEYINERDFHNDMGELNHEAAMGMGMTEHHYSKSMIN